MVDLHLPRPHEVTSIDTSTQCNLVYTRTTYLKLKIEHIFTTDRKYFKIRR